MRISHPELVSLKKHMTSKTYFRSTPADDFEAPGLGVIGDTKRCIDLGVVARYAENGSCSITLQASRKTLACSEPMDGSVPRVARVLCSQIGRKEAPLFGASPFSSHSLPNHHNTAISPSSVRPSAHAKRKRT